MTRRMIRLFTLALSVSVLSAQAFADNRPIDAEHSTVTVLVFKSGLFSALADDHVIKAPIASGSISEDQPLAVSMTIHAADLRVLDPGLSEKRRAEVQTRMLGPEVLDVAQFAEIRFASTRVDPSGPERWQVTGRLTIRDHERTMTFPVTRSNGKYVGEAVIKQRDFGIEPIKVAGGTVKVKDELRVQFEIVR